MRPVGVGTVFAHSARTQLKLHVLGPSHGRPRRFEARHRFQMSSLSPCQTRSDTTSPSHEARDPPALQGKAAHSITGLFREGGQGFYEIRKRVGSTLLIGSSAEIRWDHSAVRVEGSETCFPSSSLHPPVEKRAIEPDQSQPPTLAPVWHLRPCPNRR